MRSLRLAAVLSIALALVPTGAHLFELPAKIRLPQQQYFVVQGIYRGWAGFGAVLIAATTINLILAMALWRRSERAWPAFFAGLLVASTLAIFFIWTFPANRATSNWTLVPGNWQHFRAQWEYSHAASAILMFAALYLSTLAAIGTRN